MNLVITGEVGAGKTSWCREYACRLRSSGMAVGGVICPAIFEEEVKTGYRVTDLLSGASATIGTLGSPADVPGEKAGRYLLSDAGLTFAKQAIDKAVEIGCDVVFLDEIGHLELAGKGLAGSAMMAYNRRGVSTVSIVRKSLLSDFVRTFTASLANGRFVIRDIGLRDNLESGN